MNKEACEDLISPLPTLDNSSLFNFSEKRPRGFLILSKKHLALVTEGQSHRSAHELRTNLRQ